MAFMWHGRKLSDCAWNRLVAGHYLVHNSVPYSQKDLASAFTAGT